MDFKERRGKFLDDACKRGKLSPDHPKAITVQFRQVENRTTGMSYIAHAANKDYTPEFLMHTKRSPT